MYIATGYAHANLEITLTYSDDTAEAYISDAETDIASVIFQGEGEIPIQLF